MAIPAHTHLKVKDKRLSSRIEQAKGADKHRDDAHDCSYGRVLQPSL